jgi:hypothetical protein
MSNDGMTPDEGALTADVLVNLRREPMGLYEVWFAANSLFPGAPMSARLAAAERVVTRLVADERVHLWRGQWIGAKDDRERVPADGLAELLLVFSTWAPEGGDSVIWMELTSAA